MCPNLQCNQWDWFSRLFGGEGRKHCLLIGGFCRQPAEFAEQLVWGEDSSSGSG